MADYGLLMPDIESVVVSRLAVMPELAVRAEVSWLIPEEDQFDAILVDKAIVVATRIGGPMRYRGSWDSPLVDFDIYADSKERALTVMAIVRREIEALQASVYVPPDNSPFPGAVIAGVREESGPSVRPDSNVRVVRVGFTYRFLIRPN